MAARCARAIFICVLVLQTLLATAWLVQAVVWQVPRFYWASDDMSQVTDHLGVSGERIFVVAVSGTLMLVSLVGIVSAVFSLMPFLLAYVVADFLATVAGGLASAAFVVNLVRLEDRPSGLSYFLYLFPLVGVLALGLLSLGLGALVCAKSRHKNSSKRRGDRASSDRWEEFN